MNVTRKALHAALKDLKSKVSNDEAVHGICHYVSNYLDIYTFPDEKELDLILKLQALFRSWPHFSGDLSFPVPSDHYVHAGDAYFAMPRWTGKYGELRKDLLNYMLRQTR